MVPKPGSIRMRVRVARMGSFTPECAINQAERGYRSGRVAHVRSAQASRDGPDVHDSSGGVGCMVARPVEKEETVQGSSRLTRRGLTWRARASSTGGLPMRRGSSRALGSRGPVEFPFL